MRKKIEACYIVDGEPAMVNIDVGPGRNDCSVSRLDGSVVAMSVNARKMIRFMAESGISDGASMVVDGHRVSGLSSVSISYEMMKAAA